MWNRSQRRRYFILVPSDTACQPTPSRPAGPLLGAASRRERVPEGIELSRL